MYTLGESEIATLDVDIGTNNVLFPGREERNTIEKKESSTFRTALTTAVIQQVSLILNFV